jgi:hypothetical protein
MTVVCVGDGFLGFLSATLFGLLLLLLLLSLASAIR